MKKFILDCRFKFETHAKNMRKKAIKHSLKITENLLDVDGYVFVYLSLIFIKVE